MRSAGRDRLPEWVVRIRSVLRFTALASLAIAPLGRQFEPAAYAGSQLSKCSMRSSMRSGRSSPNARIGRRSRPGAATAPWRLLRAAPLRLRPAPSPRIAPDPHRTRRRAREVPGIASSTAPIRPAIAISASATRSPPSETSWTAVTAPIADERAHEVAMAALGGEIDRRWRALLQPAYVAQIDRLTEPAVRFADQQDRLPSDLNAIVIDLVKSSRTPTPPMVGVGRIARPLVSL